MWRFAGLCWLGAAGALVLVGPVACGGRVTGGGGGLSGGQCPIAASVQPGSSCASSGTTCPSTYQACGGDLSCTCNDGTWSCPAPPCNEAPACPTPGSISAGGTCGTPSGLQCTSAIAVYDCDGQLVGDQSCSCVDGAWQCFALSEPVCIDASIPPACPAAATVEQGVPCQASSLTCPGNPSVCDGAVFYDAFECQGGTWNDVAHTDCATEGGAGSD